jgi:NADH-quinone oxidoreductase subunit M
MGGYGFIKVLLNLFPVGCYYFLPLVYTMAIVGIILSSMIAIIQNDFKKLIAYTSIAHMNFVVLGIFSFNQYGLVVSVFLMYAHGIVSSGLFASVGLLYDRYKTRQIEFYGGLVMGMPIFSTLLFFFILGNFGFPLTFNFIGELLILFSLAQVNLYVYFIAGFAIFTSVIYSVLLYNKLIFGNPKEFIQKMTDVTLLEFHYLLAMAVVVLLFGIFPNLLIDYYYFEVLYYIVK